MRDAREPLPEPAVAASEAWGLREVPEVLSASDSKEAEAFDPSDLLQLQEPAEVEEAVAEQRQAFLPGSDFRNSRKNEHSALSVFCKKDK